MSAREKSGLETDPAAWVEKAEHEGAQASDERRRPDDPVRLVVAALLLFALAFLSLAGARFMEMFRETGRLDLGPLPFSTRVLVSGHPAIYMTVYGLAAVALVVKDLLVKGRLLVWRINLVAFWLGVALTLVYFYALLRPIMGPGHGL